MNAALKTHSPARRRLGMHAETHSMAGRGKKWSYIVDDLSQVKNIKNIGI